ncbi:MAG: patatin-like phospholipase family protein [Rickettsiales bacterium]|jgi:NTE family protein|nr:patatin-like phospholipase family protein [Rickettsiales bacterium]
MPKNSKTLPISLALQGGGAHAAYSWGVIDQLLQDETIEIEAISATSGGAMLAVVAAQGLMEGGREGARDALLKFWRKANIAAGLLPIRTTIADKFLGSVGIDLSPSSMALDVLTKMFSPYQFNLFDINPMKSIIEEMVDFKALNKKSPIPLYINTTHARTGKSRVFDHSEVSLDAVMASCCLPYIFRTVEIDGEPYWDGSFSACPALAPLVGSGRDIMLVEVHPHYVEEIPTGAADILDRMTEISFTAALLSELRAIEQYNSMIESGALKQKPVTMHRIEAQDILLGLGRSSKLNLEWSFLMYLHDIGIQSATDWLEKRR